MSTLTSQTPSTCQNVPGSPSAFLTRVQRSYVTLRAEEGEPGNEASFTNLRTSWLTVTSVMVCWDPPAIFPPEYTLIHSAIVVSGGFASVTYQSQIVNGVESCTLLSIGVNRANINIFFLYQDLLNSEILIEGI